MKTCLILLAIREMQIQTAMLYNFIPNTMATIKKADDITRMGRNWNPHKLMVYNVKRAAALKNSLTLIKRLNTE